MFFNITTSYTIYILIYVDDIVITGSSSIAITNLISILNSTFSLKNLGKLSYFLGTEVSYPSTGDLFLSQTKYKIDLFCRTNMEATNANAIPMVSTGFLSATVVLPFLILLYKEALWEHYNILQ